MKRYNIINNSLGWLCFIIAAVTYMLTLEPTASFWDCPEFILQGYKLEIGHPPGNPIFMLAARFFTNFAFGDVTKVALMVNAMSGLLSAGTILLLFWTITHMVKRLTVADDATEVSPLKMLVIFGSGICGALMYAWSDTFWFSAVEGEVYAFSSFCTALVFWLILKWENRADKPHSDKYLVFIAYVIGISIAVHLLNLLCIPAIVLVVYYKKFANPTGKGSLIALLVSFVIVALILYGLVPGFINMAQFFELTFVNGMGLSFNMGTLIYAIVLVALFCWTIYELYRQRNPLMMKISFILSVFLSGIFWIGHSVTLLFLLTAALAAYLFVTKKLPVRVLNLVAISILVIFVGYSSYALLLIRSSAHTPMNQNAPDNVFSLATYLNREQYGERPLIFGETFESQPVRDASTGSIKTITGEKLYAKKVKESPDEKDRYTMYGEKQSYVMSPELNMLFPRIYSSDGSHRQAYSDWIGGLEGNQVMATVYQDAEGNSVQQEPHIKPTFGENFRFFMNYQLNHMYWRYFMWNFAGRQNDIQGNGEVNHGNWISGIPFIDNPRLGDQSLLPYDEGEGNAGHNVFFLLPLIMGIIGLGWQAFTSKRGIEQFWVVFFLFFMTGIAIVVYLNQTPGQPRERDYAFAGSFYAYAIWVGMGVAGLWRLIVAAMRPKKEKATEAVDEPAGPMARKSLIAACIAAVVGILVPLQVVSQTWDDHDRSGRYAARDFGMNYLNSLDPNAIIFTYGDNDTFPLWYAQEVEGVRTDVKVVNLSYLTTDWYIDQIRRPSYDSKGVPLQAAPTDYAYNNLAFAYIIPGYSASDSVPAIEAVKEIYQADTDNDYGVTAVKHPRMYIPVNLEQMVKDGHLSANDLKNPLFMPLNAIQLDFENNASTRQGLYLNNIMALDMLSQSAANGWNRPIYYAMTVPDRSYMGLNPYMRSTGLTYEVTPLLNRSSDMAVNTEKAYRNITERFQWGGLDKVTEPGQVYLDETVRRMVTTNRSAMLDLSIALLNEGLLADSIAGPDQKTIDAFRADRFNKSRNVLNLMREKLPTAAMPFAMQVGEQVAMTYFVLGEQTNNDADKRIAREILRNEIDRYTTNILYYQSLSPSQYMSLQNTDRYIDMIYFLDLIDSYRETGGNTDKLVSELSAKGVNLNRQLEYRERSAREQAE
ncbi:MAG: DUF2723 domain-containing protein [Firmicutes bacterium]|nr:DUF2723 domain-containing protein [Bacillota bacterium]MCM1401046.1 DUF2723 domain-containing protein [Bacteroides sp.]MCM1476965.1 DUF2723 domain-containing protein [Bacteroides sp.]